MIGILTVQLTSAQAHAVAWALDAMRDYWEAEADEADPNRLVPRPVQLPKLTRLVVTIDNVHAQVLEDLEYRLVELLPSLDDDQGKPCPASVRAWQRISSASQVIR